jgi:hypothetical protein
MNHGYYAHHGFETVAEFKSDWKTDSDDWSIFLQDSSNFPLKLGSICSILPIW